MEHTVRRLTEHNNNIVILLHYIRCKCTWLYIYDMFQVLFNMHLVLMHVLVIHVCVQFGGNAVAMAAAEAVLCIMEDEELQQNATVVGEYLMQEAKKLMAEHPQYVGDVRYENLSFVHSVDVTH